MRGAAIALGGNHHIRGRGRVGVVTAIGQQTLVGQRPRFVQMQRYFIHLI